MVVAEAGLKWQDDANSLCSRSSIMYRVPAVLLVLLLSLDPCALRAQTTNGSITGRVDDASKGCGRGRGISESRVTAKLDILVLQPIIRFPYQRELGPELLPVLLPVRRALI